MTHEQYALLAPYLKHIETEQCHLPKVCDELATLHEAFGYGFVNRTCSGCISEMMKTLNAHKIEYEKQIQSRG